MPKRACLLTLFLAAATAAAQDQRIPPDGPEVATTGSGLRWSVLAAGRAGERPRPGDKVHFHYSGWLEQDGKLFETSRRRAEPLEMFLGVAMPKAWVEALRMMTPGARLKVVAPPELCYGATGTPGLPPDVPPVPPGATLVLELELFGSEPGIALPEYTLPDPARQQQTASGLRYEVLAEGSGDEPRPGERVELAFALWNERAQLVVTSLLPSEKPIALRVGAVPDPETPRFLGEIAGRMRVAQRVRVEVPPELCYGDTDRGWLLPPRSRTIWYLEALRIDPAPERRAVPAFAHLDPGKAQRTKSGLRYEVIRQGEGKGPVASDLVEFHYAGWLTSGKLFDESMSKGLPQRARIRGEDRDLVPGLVEGLQMMRAGAVYRFVLPPELAFGLFGNKPLGIGPNRFVHYYVELIGIEEQR